MKLQPIAEEIQEKEEIYYIDGETQKVIIMVQLQIRSFLDSIMYIG